MYKKISKNEKITRNISEVHSADNQLTKETTENVSLAVARLNGNTNPQCLRRYYTMKLRIKKCIIDYMFTIRVICRGEKI